jgi:hypothetical protein
MVRELHSFVRALALALCAAGAAFGQNQAAPDGGSGGTLPSLPSPAVVPAPSAVQPIPPPAPAGCAVIGQPPLAHCNPYEDCNGPLLKCNPCLDSPAWAPPGWFFGMELDIVGSHIKNRLVGQVGDDTLHVPTAELDGTVAPRFEVGYRFAQGAGELLLAYRFLSTSGSQKETNFDGTSELGQSFNTFAQLIQNNPAIASLLGPINLHTRLDINAWDIDYGSREYSLWPCWDMRWRAGVRFAGIYFDSTESNAVLQQKVSNYYFGVGPHIGLDLRRFIMGTEFQLIGRIESALLIGQAWQTFEEQVTIPGVGSAFAASNRSNQQLVAPWLNVQLGVGWTPHNFDHFTFSAGYTFEVWWDIADVGDSRGNITDQGVFLRAELRF